MRFFNGKICEREKISKYVGKYINVHGWFFYINLVFPYFTSGSISIASFTSATDVPVGLITYFITIYFTWSNGFAKLFLRRLKSKKLSIKKLK